MKREYIFNAVKALRGGRAFTGLEVKALDAAIDEALGIGHRRISTEGLSLIKSFEGLRLQAYRCPADVPTIGYGSTGPHVRMGMTITEQEAEDLLTKDLERFEKGVSALVPQATDGEFAAMVSLAFNVGLAAFGGSTLLRKHNAGDRTGAAAEFAKWKKAGGRMLPGLVRRRASEALLYKGVTA